MSEATVETLFDRDGERSAYQTRVKCGRFRIHIFWRGDRDPDMHDHPATFWTFPLVSYVEEVVCKDDPARGIRQVVRAFRLHHRRAEYAHRVLGAWNPDDDINDPDLGFWPGIDQKRPIVTLGWWGKKRREWGFHTPRGWIGWRSYVNQPGWTPALDTAPVALPRDAGK